MTGYDFRAIEDRWLPVWESLGLFARRFDGRPRRTVVDMFAYPSGDLHMGHAEAYAIGDAIARYWRLRGYDVLHPIGWDSFGLPAENAAIKRGLDPAEWTYANIETQAATFRRYGVSIDWTTRLHTSDPSFYRWTQWLFLRFFERGLAYREQAPVNWCPTDRTVLANEQVIGGKCERCGSTVVEKSLTQWFFRITAYADRLLAGLSRLEGHWPSPVLAMQRNWIPGLHDWLISRQRRWGCPIPIVHCPSCGLVPATLPVLLSSPVAMDCPACGGPARRDTDTMDTFVDSSWYFLRYPDVTYEEGPFDPAAARAWLPVDDYIGGAEHAVSHLLYARFVTKVLHDIGLIDFDEPFRALTTQGQVILNGAAMSKSKGNMVTLGDELTRHGVDAVRVAMLFAGPPSDDIDWADVSPTAAARFLARALRVATRVGPRVGSQVDSPGDGRSPGPGGAEAATALRRETHRLLREITELVEARRLNVAVARTMQLVSAANHHADPADPALRETAEAIAVVLSLFAPYTAEEMWHRLGHPPGIATTAWPAIDPELAALDTVVCAIQVDGKVRDRIEVPAAITEPELTALALASPAAIGRRVTRTIVRAPKLVNLVTAR
ncbi:class I tRNA ligase family protein [Actinoplanes sp. CA-030573]|uniref:class I tRNA ligase family protein n=1 Tax=Actinoplanes sp. CA-030573 TaxID=3239898 RepID=UPI003D9148EC